jgi:hypothetical protein
MKQQKEYKLEEAIKNFYTTEPLKADLATTVADKVFEKHKKVYPAFETWLYIFIGSFSCCGNNLQLQFFKPVFRFIRTDDPYFDRLLF